VTDLAVGAVIQADVGATRVDVFALERVVGHAEPTINAGVAPARADEVALGARTMRTLHVRVGGTITAQVGSRAASYRVVGRAVFPEFGDSGQLGTGAFMTVDGVHRINAAAPRNTFLIRFAPGPDAAAERARLVMALEPLPSRSDARPEDLVNLAHGEGLLGVLGLVLGLLALAMLVHALLTSVRSGRRQHAILRALGFTRRGSRRVVRWQSLTLALIAALIGLPIGVVAGRRAWITYAGLLGVVADPFVPVRWLLLGVGAAVVIAIVAAVVPGWIETRVRSGRALRNNE
jgi:putative ABC transport system permease protein